jgi:hypothetical protein
VNVDIFQSTFTQQADKFTVAHSPLHIHFNGTVEATTRFIENIWEGNNLSDLFCVQGPFKALTNVEYGIRLINIT